MSDIPKSHSFEPPLSVGIGFIALLGICMQNGILLITVFKENLRKEMSLAESLRMGVASQLCLVVMTVFMATISLFPVPLNTASSSEMQKPPAIVIIGGLMTATVLIFPLIFVFFYREMHQDGPVLK